MIRVDIISNAELNIAALEVSTGIELKLTSGCNIVNYKAREKNENVHAYKAHKDWLLAIKVRVDLLVTS